MKEKFDNQIVLVCSDDSRVIEYAIRNLDKSVVLTSSEIPQLAGQPYQIPFVNGAEAREKLSMDALVDLVAQGDLDLFDHAGVRRRDLHRGLVALDGDQALLGRNGVAGLDQYFNDGDFVKIANVGDLNIYE